MQYVVDFPGHGCPVLVELQPLAGLMDTPFRIYAGHLRGALGQFFLRRGEGVRGGGQFQRLGRQPRQGGPGPGAPEPSYDDLVAAEPASWYERRGIELRTATAVEAIDPSAGEARERLLPHMAEGNRAKTAAAPVVALLAMDVDFHEELPRTFPHAPGLRDMLDGDEDARRSTALLSAGLQIGYAIMGVRAAGLAAGPMTGLDADAVTREFFPDGRHQVIAVVNVGHPAENAWMDRLPRLPYEDAVTLL
mgnify:CR=1 FL=1